MYLWPKPHPTPGRWVDWVLCRRNLSSLTFLFFPNYYTDQHLVHHPPSLPPCLRAFRPPCEGLHSLDPSGVLRFHSHPQLLVPEQQFAAGFVELQPVDLGVVADGSQVVACSQVHWGREEHRWIKPGGISNGLFSRYDISQLLFLISHDSIRKRFFTVS